MYLIIDVKNLVYRSLWGETLTTPQGFNITPLYGTIRSVIALLKRWPNTRAIVACCDPIDEYRPHWRKAIYPEYKADRQAKRNVTAAAAAKVVQDNLPYVRAFFHHINCLWLEDPALEADDLIAWTVGMLGSSVHKLILGGDWDMFQLVTYPSTEVAVPEHRAAGGNARYTILNAANFSEAIRPMLLKRLYRKEGREEKIVAPLPPEYYLALACMSGDKSDNINGLARVPGNRALEIINVGRTKTSSTLPWDLYEAWATDVIWAEKPSPARKYNDGTPITRHHREIVEKNPDARKILERNYSLMRLDPSKAQSPQKWKSGVFSHEALLEWFGQLNFRSYLEGGASYDEFKRYVGPLARFG